MQQLLNESRAFDPSLRQEAGGGAPPAGLHAADLAEQLLYEVQSLDLPARRRLMPRVYGFAAAQANSSTEAQPPPPPSSDAARTVFGWPASRRANAAAASVICLVVAASAGAAFALGARWVRLPLRLLSVALRHRLRRSAHKFRPPMNGSAMWSARARSAGACGRRRPATVRTTATPELPC